MPCPGQLIRAALRHTLSISAFRPEHPQNPCRHKTLHGLRTRAFSPRQMCECTQHSRSPWTPGQIPPVHSVSVGLRCPDHSAATRKHPSRDSLSIRALPTQTHEQRGHHNLITLPVPPCTRQFVVRCHLYRIHRGRSRQWPRACLPDADCETSRPSLARHHSAYRFRRTRRNDRFLPYLIESNARSPPTREIRRGHRRLQVPECLSCPADHIDRATGTSRRPRPVHSPVTARMAESRQYRFPENTPTSSPVGLARRHSARQAPFSQHPRRSRTGHRRYRCQWVPLVPMWRSQQSPHQQRYRPPLECPERPASPTDDWWPPLRAAQ